MDVLVVDDEVSVRNLFAHLLRALGHRVTTAADGAEALCQARRQRPDLVLLDREMPVMDGIEAARAIRSLPGRPATIYMVSSRDDAVSRAEAAAAGIACFFRKPLMPSQLCKLVEEFAESGSWR